MSRPTASRLGVAALACAGAAAFASPALAGPPYLTDDPAPTDPGHWEIYNFAIASRDRDGLDGEAGFDINYGAAKDLQLTAVLPVAFDDPRGFSSHDLHAGGGPVELAVKYQVLHQAEGSWLPDVAFFPRAFVPTDHNIGPSHANFLLPVWAQKDFGPWALFGGGGYQINPGLGQRDFWQGGAALTRDIDKRLSLGAEVFAQGRDSVAGGGFSALNFAATYKLVEHWSLLASAGPSWLQGGGTGRVFYLSLKADY